MYSSKTKQIYVRKLFPHDLTHEVSVTTEIVTDFFEGRTSMVFYKGADRDRKHTVTINSATDPRFGGDFVSLWSSDMLQVDDLILIKKLGGNEYELTTTRKGEEFWNFINSVLTGNQRHAVLVSEEKSQQSQPPIAKKASLPQQYTQLRTAIRTKPFLILGGFSGTGKSQKVKELAYLTCPKELQGEKSPGNYALISVKPNWHDSTELLGYESNIAHKYMVTDFMRFCVKAMQYPDVPFFCCLDEMNLAPVEEYFAEYLSVLESRKKNAEGEIVSEPLVSASVFTKSYKGGDIFGELGMEMEEKMIGGVQSISYSGEALEVIESLQMNGLCLPQNLVVIGTVNMDDTTNSFSRKVIDRAMTFETDIERFSDIDYFNAENTLQYGNVDGSMFICDEVRSDEAIARGFEVTLDEQMQFINFIDGINDAMNGTSFQVSYRVMNEAVLYYRAMKLLNKDVEVNLHQVFNDILLMKVLPRIEGDSQAKKALEGLAEYMTGEDANLGDMREDESPWKKSYVKVKEMIALLNEGDGFTRFWK